MRAWGIMERNQYYFSNTNVMYQKNSHNNARKETFLPHTPQTRLEQRPSLYEESDVCLQHSSPLQLVCLTCCLKLLCSQCLQFPSHLNHQVRSIQRAKQLIFSQYQEWMVRLSSKKEILDIIERHFATSKADLNSFAKRYKEKVNLEFSEIITMLQDKHREVVDSIDGFTREYTDEMSTYMEQIRDKMKKIQNIVEHYDKERIDLVPVAELAAYSYQIRNKVNSLLDQHDIANFKEQLVEPEWSISGVLLQQIKRSINALGVNFNDLYQRQPKASYIQQEKSKKKGKKEMKLFDTNSREKSQNKLKQSASSKIIFQTTLTPKNKSIQKKVKQKRSPEIELLKKRKKSSAKMISMPASPAKDVETTYLITPEMSRKKLFKKK